MIRVAFVLEQALGHATHGRNIERGVERSGAVEGRFVPIEFAAGGLAGRLPVVRSNWTVRAGLRARDRLRRLLRGWHPDVVFFHTQVPAVLAARVAGPIPVVVSVDATPVQFDALGAAYQHAAGPAWLERLKWRLNRDCFARAARVVAFSHWVEASLVADYGVDPGKVEVVRPGLDLTRYAGGEPDETANEPTDRPLRILFVGGDFVRKGGSVLLAAFAQLADLDVELDVVTRSAVEAPDRCTVHTGLSADSPALLELYRRADVFCMPTRADALGLVFAEAGAAGLPLVGCDVGAVTEVVRDGETGIVVPVDDPDALAQALRSLLVDADLRRRYGAAARALVTAEYDLGRTTARLVDLLQDVVAGRPAAVQAGR